MIKAITFGDDRLHQKSEKILEINDKTIQLIKNMYKTIVYPLILLRTISTISAGVLSPASITIS